MIETIYRYFLVCVCILLSICILFAIIRSIKGPKVADRVVAINMASTMVIMIIAILTIYYKETYLDDVCLVYALISFVAIVVLTNVFVNVNMRKKYLDEKNQEKEVKK